MSDSSVKESVREYYGRILENSKDLQTNACCTPASANPPAIREALGLIHDEVITKYYGCGLTIPDELEGLTVVDLGSGSGRDCYILSRLVGEKGRVIGIDMTDEQIAVARRHVDFHADRFGYRESNVEFHKGYIESLSDVGIGDESVDLIVSNCVINLSPDKESVLREAYRVLKPGGELYFSDVYSDRRVPEHLQEDRDLYGECLSGALYWNDFENLAKRAGFTDPRLVEDSRITISNPELEARTGNIRFFSATYRLFKLDQLEPACEDYGQAVIYKGTIPGAGEAFRLDAHHVIEKGRVFPVCSNTHFMLHGSRYRKHFEFIGDMSTHYGLFEGCGSAIPFESAATTGGAATPSSGACC